MTIYSEMVIFARWGRLPVHVDKIIVVMVRSEDGGALEGPAIIAPPPEKNGPASRSLPYFCRPSPRALDVAARRGLVQNQKRPGENPHHPMAQPAAGRRDSAPGGVTSFERGLGARRGGLPSWPTSRAVLGPAAAVAWLSRRAPVRPRSPAHGDDERQHLRRGRASTQTAATPRSSGSSPRIEAHRATERSPREAHRMKMKSTTSFVHL